jgi:hypothetical protein
MTTDTLTYLEVFEGNSLIKDSIERFPETGLESVNASSKLYEIVTLMGQNLPYFVIWSRPNNNLISNSIVLRI